MARNRTSPGSSPPPVPPGTHLARCYRVIDLGTQTLTSPTGAVRRPGIMVQFELHGEDGNSHPLATDSGEPLTVSKSYALSLSENAALRQDLTAWRGRAFTPAELRGFVLKNILGEWAMLTVARAAGGTSQAHSEITGIAGAPEALSQAGLPPGHHEPVQFTISQADLDVFETFPKAVKKRIQGSPEWKAFSKRRSSGALDDEAYE